MSAQALVQALIARGETVATAESLTAGLLSAHLCNVPGASGCFQGGVAAYQDAVKEAVLCVPPAIIQAHSAVSAPCACAMARGARQLFHTSYALSTTGYAGPTGAQVGLVYIGLSTEKGEKAFAFHFRGSRQGIREMTARIAMYILQKEINDHGKEG